MRFRERLIERLGQAAVPVPSDDALDKLQAYFELLARWNRTINLTSLPLDKPTDETFDRLFTEPLAAARYFPADASNWFDLGSGGGSPAVPLLAVTNAVHLTMVESRERKAAFLREVVRNLELAAEVANVRFEDVTALDASRGQADVVTVRAVRPDATVFGAASALLARSGRLLIFQSHPQSTDVGGFRLRSTNELIPARQCFLAVYAST